MRYSLKDEDVKKLYLIQEQVSENIQNNYLKFISDIISWGKKMDSQLVLDISKQTVGMIGDNVWTSYVRIFDNFDDSKISFVNISERFYVGEEAIGKARDIQDRFKEKMSSYVTEELNYQCTGNTQYEDNLIQEYQELILSLLSRLEECFEEDREKALALVDENILSESLEYLIKIQYDLLINTVYFYDKIFEAFLEWYEETLKENISLLEEIIRDATNNTEEIGEEELTKILSNIMDAKISTTMERENVIRSENIDNENNIKDSNREELIEKAVKNSIDALVRELNTPEKIKAFKKYVVSCEQQVDECKNDISEDKKSKFKKLGNFLKEGAKKFGKPLAKALSIMVPLIAPESSLVTKIATAIPEIIDCFSGKVEVEKDVKRVDLGVDCLKILGVDKFPESEEELQKYIKDNSGKIAKELINKIMNNKQHMEVLGIDNSSLNDPKLQSLYLKETGKTLKNIPSEINPYDYDFNSYNPKKLNNLSPKIGKKILDNMSMNIMENTNIPTNVEYMSKLNKELLDVKRKLDSKEGFVLFENNPEIEKLIQELRKIVEFNKATPILDNIDGRYNKQEVGKLILELLEERSKVDDLQLKNGLSNFLRRQMGYPAINKDNDIVIKELQELIPVLNEKEPSFIVNDKELRKLINDAQNINYQKNGEIKKKNILLSLWENATILGGTVGVGALLAISGVWPLGLLYTWSSIGVLLNDNTNSAYSKLVLSLGEKRTDYLLGNYNNLSGNRFEVIK